MDSGQDTWFAPLMTSSRDRSRSDDISKASGGLPHSEIHGSKLILSSPWLIAEYHVLHRLLLPRHPPNALLALDPIQRRQGSIKPRKRALRKQQPAFCVLACPSRHRIAARRTPGRKSYISRPSPAMQATKGHWLVYLTWNKTAAVALGARAPPAPRASPHSGNPAVLMFLSLHDVNMSSDGSNGTAPLGADRCDHARRRRHWWVEEDSNLRPHAYQACALTT